MVLRSNAGRIGSTCLHAAIPGGLLVGVVTTSAIETARNSVLLTVEGVTSGVADRPLCGRSESCSGQHRKEQS